MSLHMATSGLSTQQLPSWRKARSDAAKALADAQEKERARVTQLRAHGDNGSAVTITNVATDGGAFGKGGPGDANSNPYKKNINQAWMGPKNQFIVFPPKYHAREHWWGTPSSICVLSGRQPA